MAKEKVKAKMPKEGILDKEIPDGKDIEFKGEIKGDLPTEQKEEETEDEQTTFHLVAKAGLLRDTIELCSELVDDIKLKIKAKGIKIQAVDPAHVCLVDLFLENDACDEFEATNIELGINLGKLSDILKLAKDIVTMDYDQKENRLIIKMDTLTRKMGVIDPESINDPNIPKLVSPGQFTMAAPHFLRTLTASEQISDHMKITVDKNGVEMFAESDADVVDDKLPKELLDSLETTGTFTSMYALDYLKNIIKGAKGAIEFGMSNDNPLQVSYKFAEGKGTVQYTLAPRIESEDNQ